MLDYLPKRVSLGFGFPGFETGPKLIVAHFLQGPVSS